MADYSVNLSDPRVQSMLGGDPASRLATGKDRSVFQICGDTPGPTGHRGMASVHHMDAGKEEVIILYRDLFMTVDVYRVPGEPLRIHLYCPRCHKHATVRGDRKAIDYDPRAPNPMRAAIRATGRPELIALAEVGRLSIAAFECPWELGGDAHVAGGVHTGASLCRQRLVIDDNLARDA